MREVGTCDICNNEAEIDYYKGKWICKECYEDLKDLEEDENEKWNR